MAHVYEQWDSDILEDMVRHGWTNSEISDYFDSSPSTVSKALKFYDINREELAEEGYTEEQADEIRDRIYTAITEIPGMTRGLAEALERRISYDEESDTWFINEYLATGYRKDRPKIRNDDFPVEIRLKHDRIRDTIKVESYNLRGRERKDLARQFQRSLR